MSAAISSNRLGFCQRCGDPISGKIRCTRCGGTSQEPRIRSSAALLPAASKPDPWAHRYVDPESILSTSQQDNLQDPSPPLSPKRSSYEPALGFGMPSRISRDLRDSAALKPSPSNESSLGTSPSQSSLSLGLPVAAEQKQRPVSQDYSAPVVKGSDGVLTKVVGSLVEPSASRDRWACADCSTLFARDSTLYAAPASLATHDASYYCRDCYAKRYSLGACKACGRDVLGSTKEDGKYVKASAGLWHGKCWKCSHCNKSSKEATEVFLGMHGDPTCEACFHRPKRGPSAEASVPKSSSKDDFGLPDVRRLTRVAASRNGPMGAAIAELTKKLGQTTVAASPKVPFSSRSSSNTSILTSTSSSRNSLDRPALPTKTHYAFANHLSTSPAKPSMTRSGSISGSPPKPRPLTAQFRDGLNLAAFKPSFATAVDGQEDTVVRRDSRSRSVSPVKRPEWQMATSPTKRGFDRASYESDKVPGSPCLAPDTSNIAPATSAADPGRGRTSGGFPRPLNSPFGKDKPAAHEPIEGDKATHVGGHSILEPAGGETRCAVCHLLPLERTSPADTDEVVMVTLSDGVHLHADCFRCSICKYAIDGSKTFVRLQEDASHPPLAAGLAAYAHPHCSPTIHLTVVHSQTEAVQGGQRSYRSSLDVASAMAKSHATHQRELKPSPNPSPAPSVRDKEVGLRPTILTDAMPVAMQRSTSSTSVGPSSSKPSSTTTEAAMRWFQPSTTPVGAGAGAGTSAAEGKGVNPAAGIFSRVSALSSASGNASLTTTTTCDGPKVRFGGMPLCAYCGEKLSSLESVLGPRGTQWHRACLICRAPPVEQDQGVYAWRKQERKWCGKKLDSGAKVNAQGEVRCRDCYGRECSQFRIKT